MNGKTAPEIVNELRIHGQLQCALRGKEIAIGIADVSHLLHCFTELYGLSLTNDYAQYIIRISFQTEGHCFWMLTTQYKQIVGGETTQRGSKGTAFQVPPELVIGPERNDGKILKITIAAAFIRPQWTLVFIDHQCFMTFHILRLCRACTPHDFDVKKSTVCAPHILRANSLTVFYSFGYGFGAKTMGLFIPLSQWRMNRLLKNTDVKILIKLG